MKPETLKKVVELSSRVNCVLVATADAKGLPHVAAAGMLTMAPDGRVAVQEWFCPATVSNLQDNSCIAIVVWDANKDFGYQLLGQLEGIEDTGILDGYAPEIESQSRMPQVERQLLIRADKIIEFSQAPHSDTEE